MPRLDESGNPINELDEYQEACAMTAIYPSEIGLAYCTMGLCGEAGEVANKVKKYYRDGDSLGPNWAYEIESEIGDCAWYLAMLCSELGLKLSEVCERNIQKLSRRREAGTLHGSGDNR